MLANFKAWYRRRILKNESIPDDIWQQTVTRLRFLRGLDVAELERLREYATLFLHAKQISGAHGLIVTDEMHVLIAAQACILILNLDLDYYNGWVEIIVYPGEFIRNYEYVDEDGVVHHAAEAVSGEAWLGGPLILSWEDASATEAAVGYNVVIHEFAHKLDMLNGDANGFPPLHADMSRQAWSEAFSEAYAAFCRRVDADEAIEVDPYAAEDPAEFFAVMSEAFFEIPLPVKLHFSRVYEQLALFYRQDPAQRWSESVTGYYISGDIGGTKVLLQATELKDGNAEVCCERRYASQEYSCFSDMLREFLRETMMLGIGSSPLSACFAVAGPIKRQVANLTNLPWVMDSAAIAREFSIPVVKLINDFKAVALGIEALPESDLVTLQAGKPSAMDLRVTLGAGTGMGVAWLTWQDNRYIPLSSEAGHTDFAPADELQDRLLQYLRKKFGHVSVERILSGPGLTNTFNFLQTDLNNTPALVQVRLKSDGAAQVADLAFNHKHPVAVKAMDLFVEVYGAYAGNLALAGLCRNGVYVAGGIAPRIIDKLREGGFMKAFRDKGRFSSLMEDIPVHVVMNPKIGLLGATQEAQRIARNN